ncbi:TetR/AcrR family transcriptional regulator [Saccharopolyspora sp. MS10]|uniref:TetR/AcrR family transcriptional regulator n=1 Tax=Saccharopolyspora sp. MS10 TaxID=3385973 RepID=UPI00399F4D8E
MTDEFPDSAGEPPLRADARRNRDQIIGAAKELFSTDGPEVPMDEIARRASVGVGTLYRRFPDRESLIRAVARDNFGNVLAHAREADAEPTAWDSLVRLLKSSDELHLSVQLGMASPRAWEIIKSDQVVQDLRDAVLAELDRVVRAAQSEGSLRHDVSTGDVAATYSLLLRRHTGAAVAERALHIMLDGLRADPGGTRRELPGDPTPLSGVHPT